MKVLDTVDPVKEVRLKNRTEPWMSADILDLMKNSDNFLYSFKKHNSQEDF